MPIKGVLREELINSLKMQVFYVKKLKSLPKGSLVIKVINSKKYYYQAARKGPKVVFTYLGNRLSNKDIQSFNESKVLRAKYRHSLSVVKKQIRYLKGVLRGKEAI